MREILLTMVFAVCLASALRGQDLQGKISCHASGNSKPQNQNYAKKLWGGYEVSLGPSRNSQGGGDECTAAIYSNAGHVVFRTTGFNVVFDETHTGQDFDGDGKPEVVFITDTGGGNHCCWTYNIISLYPKPHKLFDIDEPGAVQFERDERGEMLVWQRLPGPYGFNSMAQAPFAEKVFRVRDAKLVDATPEFCAQILSDKNEEYQSWNSTLTPENIRKLPSTEGIGAENEEIVSALLSRALQHVFCRQFDEALKDLNLWPEASRATMKVAFAESIKQDYPEFSRRLAPAGRTASAQANNTPPKISMFLNLGDQETFLAAKLSAAQRKQIIDQVEKTSFDVPDDWESELRLRRVTLGEAEGLVIRGTQLLCGGTGNCETWVFRRSQGNWLNLFEQEAPVVSAFGFAPEASTGIKNFVVSANSSAEKESRMVFKFDGKFYRQRECYAVSHNGAAEKVEKVPCK